VATITIVIVEGTVAAVFFLSPSGDTDAMPGATAVGVPNGPVTTKSIGQAGGSIASPDGRITVTVPPNAVPGSVEFRIQPITNLTHGGLGNAYRLEPSDQKFSAPISVSFNFGAQDLKNSIPESLAVAYQDKTGVWQSFKNINIDQGKKTLTVSTDHFTDFSIWTVRLSPEKATLHLRETQHIELIGCIERLNLLTRIRTLLGRPDCRSLSPDDASWSVDIGTITPAGPGAVVYQAPATRPSTNVATVRFEYKLQGSDETNIKDVRTCEITIVGQGYRASGKVGTTVFSGDICDLKKPFTVKNNNQYMQSFEFAPSSPTAGTWSFSYKNGVVGRGGGEYTIEGTETEKTAIVLNGSATGAIRGYSKTGFGPLRIDLAPVETDDCAR
jgi:hypothetical protein